MLGLGSSLTKGGAGAKTIVNDNLLLKHNYSRGQVHQVSTGAAYFVEGNADYITMGDVAAFSDADGFSISFWVNFVTLNGNTALVTKHANMADLNNAGSFYIINDDGICEFIVVDHTNSASIGTSTGTVFTANQWHHVACTHDGGTAASGLLIYIDGVLQAHNDTSTGSGFANIVDTTAEFRLGTFSDDGEPHDGYMCNVGFWSTVLTQAEVKSIWYKNYADLTTSEKTSLVSWWNLDTPPEAYAGGDGYVYDNHHGGSTAIANDQAVDGVFNVDTATNTAGTNWTTSADWVVDNGVATLSGTTNNRDIKETTGSLTQGAWYKVSLDITFDAGTGELYIGSVGFATNSGNYANITHSSGSGSYEVFFRSAISSDGEVFVIRGKNTSGATFTVTVDNVTIQKINGNTGTLI